MVKRSRGRKKGDIGESRASSNTLYLIASGVDYLRGISRATKMHVRASGYQIEQLLEKRLIKERKNRESEDPRTIHYEIDYIELTKLFLDRAKSRTFNFISKYHPDKTKLAKNKDFHELFEFIFKNIKLSVTLNFIFDYLIDKPNSVVQDTDKNWTKEFYNFFGLYLLKSELLEEATMGSITSDYREKKIKGL